MKRPSASFLLRIVAMITLLVIPVWMGWVIIRLSDSETPELAHEFYPQMAMKIADRVSDQIKAADDKLRFALSIMQRNDFSWQTRQDILRNLVESNADIEAADILKDGKVLLHIYNPDLNKDGSLIADDKDAYQQYRRARHRAWSVSAQEGKAPRLHIYYPYSTILDLRVSVVLNTLWQSITGERVGQTGFVMLIGPDGQPIIYPRDRLSADDWKDLSQRHIEQIALRSMTSGFIEIRLPDGRKMLEAHAPVPELPGVVLIRQPKGEAHSMGPSNAKQMAKWIIIFFEVISALCILVLIWVEKRSHRMEVT